MVPNGASGHFIMLEKHTKSTNKNLTTAAVHTGIVKLKFNPNI